MSQVLRMQAILPLPLTFPSSPLTRQLLFHQRLDTIRACMDHNLTRVTSMTIKSCWFPEIFILMNSIFSLEMEALYRAQLDHFATGIARQPFLLYPSIGNPFQGSPLGLVQPQLSGIVMQPAGMNEAYIMKKQA